MAIPKILVLDDASVQISTDDTAANLKELGCVGNHIELAPDVSTTSIETFCGAVDYPGVVKWSLVATLYQSFDTDATEDVLSQALASGGPVMFAVMGYKSQPPSATNPVWSGLVIPQEYSPINGDAGDASEVELEWGIVGAPTKGITAPTTTAARTAAKAA